MENLVGLPNLYFFSYYEQKISVKSVPFEERREEELDESGESQALQEQTVKDDISLSPGAPSITRWGH